MASLNQSLSVVAPWVWVTGSILAIITCGRAWYLSNLVRKNSVTSHIKRTTAVLTTDSFMLAIVGLLSIGIHVAYPQMQQQRFQVPVLFQYYQFFALLSFLALPFSIALIGYWKIRFLLTDDVSQRSF